MKSPNRPRQVGGAWVTTLPFCVMALGHPLQATASDRTLIIWHNLETRQADLLQDMSSPVARESGLELRLETGFDLSTALARRRNSRLPDAILAPADLAGLDDVARFSEVPARLVPAGVPADVRQAVSIRGKLRGVPLFLGNHLMLFFNRRLVAKAPEDFESLYPKAAQSKTELFGWNYREPYFLFPFLGAFQEQTQAPDVPPREPCPFSESRMAEALESYHGLERARIVPRNCDYDCMTQGFYRGIFPFSISGDWALEEARKQLGENLGVAPLPRLGGRKIPSYYMPTALFFPNDSLQGPKAKALIALASAIAGNSAQKRWLAEARRLPANLALTTNPLTLPTPELRDSLRILQGAKPFPRLPNAWFWPALRRAFELFLDSGRSAREAARLVVEICALKSTSPEEPLP